MRWGRGAEVRLPAAEKRERFDTIFEYGQMIDDLRLLQRFDGQPYVPRVYPSTREFPIGFTRLGMAIAVTLQMADGQ